MALPAIAAERRSTVPCCCGARRAAIDRYVLPAEPTAANPLHAAAAGEWDIQTDGRTRYRYIDPAPLCYAGSANKQDRLRGECEAKTSHYSIYLRDQLNSHTVTVV